MSYAVGASAKVWFWAALALFVTGFVVYYPAHTLGSVIIVISFAVFTIACVINIRHRSRVRRNIRNGGWR